jgi:hypothetical protein
MELQNKRRNIKWVLFTVCLLGFSLVIFIHKKNNKHWVEGHFNTNQLINFAVGVRGSAIRMIIAGVPLAELRFNKSEQLQDLKNPEHGVFHPEGGAVVYKDPPLDYLQDPEKGEWHFNANFQIKGIESKELPGSSDLIAYFVGVKKEICQKINERSGIVGIPRLQSDQSKLYTADMIDGYILPINKQPDLDHKALKGQPFGCFESFDGGTFVYYHLLIER